MTSPRYRLIALDIDGTLLTTSKGVSPRTRAALEEARRAGAHIVLVTGRRYPAALKVARELAHAVPLVLHNGALIVEDGRVLRCRPLPREAARRAVRIGRARGADPVLHCGHAGEGRLVVEAVAESNTLLVYYLDRSHPDVVRLDSVEEALGHEDPLQVMFGGQRRDMDALLADLVSGLGREVRIERTVYPASGTAILDVIAAGETMAIGDNWNDREMLQGAGLGLVMGNADPGMLALGLPVLPGNDEDGVAVAVERHVLGL
jgi:hypothetical protein